MAKPLTTDSLRCYDNGGKTVDRYTIAPPRSAASLYRSRADGKWTMAGASEAPFHPLGMGYGTWGQVGPHLGKRVPFESLPADVQRFARLFFSIREAV